MNFFKYLAGSSMKCLFIILSFVISFQLSAKEFIVVGISGFATKRDGKGQPSGVHDHLPIHSKFVRNYFKLVHFSKKSELQEVIDQFNCRDGKQTENNLGLILMINSWGAKNGERLAQMYFDQCSQKAEVAYIIDGVAKPIGAFGKAPIAKKCFSFYQTKGAVRGKAIEGCHSEDYTEKCERAGLGPVQCHISVEWWGSQRAEREINNSLLR